MKYLRNECRVASECGVTLELCCISARVQCMYWIEFFIKPSAAPGFLNHFLLMSVNTYVFAPQVLLM